jgi:hypothetical protein
MRIITIGIGTEKEERFLEEKWCVITTMMKLLTKLNRASFETIAKANAYQWNTKEEAYIKNTLDKIQNRI